VACSQRLTLWIGSLATLVASISETAEEKLRETCTQVFAGIGETLQERLQQMLED